MQRTAELYVPSMDENKNYNDKLPGIYPSSGMYCECNKRQTIFYTKPYLKSHIHTKTHMEWLENLNNNKEIMCLENKRLNEELKEKIKTNAEKAKRISQLENENKSLSVEIKNHIKKLTNILEINQINE